MSKKTIRLTMKELMSLEIGLDTGEEEFIDKDVWIGFQYL